MLFDDLQNGRFDAFLPAPGSEATYSVVDDGGGNLVARLTDNTHLWLHDYVTEVRLWENYEMTVKVKRGAVGVVSFGVRWNLPTRLGYWLSNSGDEWALSRQEEDAVATLQTATRSTPVDTWFELRILVRTTDEGALIEASLDSEPVVAYVDPDPIEIGAIEFRVEGVGSELRLDDLLINADVDSRYTWTQTGGPFGGSTTDIAVDPTDWRTAYVGGWDGGVYKTTDGGATWIEVGLPNGMWKVRILNIELAPSAPSVVYVVTGPKGVSSLWRSDDGGATWRWTAAADMTFGVDAPAEPGEHLDEPGDVDVNAIAIDPTDPMKIYVGLHDQGIWQSTDGGTTLNDLGSGGGVIKAIVVDPGNPAHILGAPDDPATSGMSVLGSTDSGGTWVPSDTGLGENPVQQLLFYPPDPTVVFAITGDPDAGRPRLLFRSADGGASWSPLEGIPGIADLRFSASGPGMLVAIIGRESFVSTDKGDSWTPVEEAIDLGSTNGAEVGADDPRVIYLASANRGVEVSTDLGASWQNLVNGLLMHPISALAVDPSNPATVYTGGTNGLYKSTDKGETWTQTSTLGPGFRDVNAVAIDPIDSNIVYMAEGIEKVMGELSKSTDGGTTWTDITGTTAYSVAALVIDPQDSSTIYAGTGGGPQAGPAGLGMYRSTDGGDTWTKLDGIPDVSVPAIAIDPLDSDHIVVGTMGHGVMVSFDGGGTFEQRNNGMEDSPPSKMIYSLAVNPENPDIMYAGTNSHYGHVSGVDALYKTTDGGRNWFQLLRGADRENEYPFLLIAAGVDTIDIVPGHPDWVYVGLHDPGVIFTDNGGADWRWANHGLIPLLTHIYPYRMAMSPDGEILYSGGCGRSVFRNSVMAAEE
jgi:photosystem II stability/assembly factor-like uncharacterized protein